MTLYSNNAAGYRIGSRCDTTKSDNRYCLTTIRFNELDETAGEALDEWMRSLTASKARAPVRDRPVRNSASDQERVSRRRIG